MTLAGGLLLKGFAVVQQQTQNRYKLLSKHIENSFGELARLDSDTRALFLKNITSADRRVLTGAADVVLAELQGQQIRKLRCGQRLIESPYVHTELEMKKFPELESACQSGCGNNLATCTELQLDQALPMSTSVQPLRALKTSAVVPEK
jgi:hypothetical protein